MRSFGFVVGGALVALVIPMAGCSTLPVECESYDNTVQAIGSQIQSFEAADAQMMQEFYAGQSVLTLEEAQAKHDNNVRTVERWKVGLRELADTCQRVSSY